MNTPDTEPTDLLDYIEPTEPVILTTESVNIEQFLVDYLSSDETITINAQWVQNQLIELQTLKREQKQLKEAEKQNKRNLSLLKSRLDSLNTTIDIMKLRVQPKIVKRRYLDVSV